LINNKIDPWTGVVFLGTFFLASLIAIILFKKRDITV